MGKVSKLEKFTLGFELDITWAEARRRIKRRTKK